MQAQHIAADNLADNLANVSTIGFKRRSAQFQSFPSMMMQRLYQGQAVPIGELATGASVRSTPIHHKQGSLNESGNTLDLAIEGKGFFRVERPNGQEAYTRAGNFRLNANSELCTMQGFPVLGETGPIVIPPEAQQVTIGKDGRVMASNVGELGQLSLAVFEDTGRLEKLSDSLFTVQGEPDSLLTPGSEAGVGRIHQGFIEMSNVKTLTEMVQLITVQRQYETMQKSISTQNQTLGQLIRDVGRL